MASVITMDPSRPTNQLGNYAAPFFILGQTTAVGSGVRYKLGCSADLPRSGTFAINYSRGSARIRSADVLRKQETPTQARL
jgi:hypothetical protein